MITEERLRNMSKTGKYVYFINRLGKYKPNRLVRDFLYIFGFIKGWRSTFYHLPGNRLCIKVYDYGISLHDGNDPMADNFTIWFGSKNEFAIKAFFKAVYDDIVDYRKIIMRIKAADVEKDLEVLE